MSDPTTLVVTATPNPDEPEAQKEYLTGALPLLMGAGGSIVKRLKITDGVGDGMPFALVLVMAFDSKEKVLAMFASEAYQALIPMRDRGFSSIALALGSDM